MKVKLNTNLPEKDALILVTKIIEYANFELDVQLMVSEFGERDILGLSAVNIAILDSILKGQEDD